jgi:hypothetical protein
MADKVEKPKKSKPKPRKDEKGVLAALPSTRPERIGGRRASAPKTFDQPQAAASAGRAKPATTSGAKSSTPKSPAARAKSSTTKSSAGARTAAAKSTAARAKSSAAAKSPTGAKAAAARATATRRKAAAPRTFEPTPAAEAAAGAAAASRPRPAPEPRPRAVREGAPGMGPSGARERGETSSAESGRPSGVELVTTAVQAAGELTQIGLTIGGRIIKRAVDRLPKP